MPREDQLREKLQRVQGTIEDEEDFKIFVEKQNQMKQIVEKPKEIVQKSPEKKVAQEGEMTAEEAVQKELQDLIP